jgi:hydrogenase-4 component E
VTGKLLPHALLIVVAVGVYALASRQLERTIKAFAVQSYALAVVAMMAAPQSEHPRHLWVLAGLTVLVKGIAVPVALYGAVQRLKIRHEIEFIVNVPSQLLIAAIGALGAFALTDRIFAGAIATLRGAAGAGMATVLVGLLVMLGRRKVITQIIGLLIMENGVILCALGLTLGMPLIVEIGVALDVLVAVQILALFAYRVGTLGTGDEASPPDPNAPAPRPDGEAPP